MEPEQAQPASTRLFFISYRNLPTDAKWAYWVAWQLEKKYGEKSCLMQDWDFDPRSNFIKGMQKGATCAFTIAILTPNYFTSEHTEDEWTAAFKDRKLILLEAAPCEPPGLLSPVFRQRLHGMDEVQARDALLQHMERVRAFAEKGRLKPEIVPTFPGFSPSADQGGSVAPCNIPHPPVHNFVPPGEAWQQLHDLLPPKSSTPGTRQVCVLHGLHGTGKTQAASVFAWEHRAEFSALLWVRGDSKEILRGSLGALCGAGALDLPEKTEPDAETRVSAVGRWLKGHPRWLLIADNIDSEEARDALLEWVPPACVGTVLVTSCLTDWPPFCSRIEFGSWHFALCAEFFIARLRLPREDWPIVAFMGDVLGGLPLAMEQAAAYMEQTRTPLESYLPKLLADVKRVLARHTLGSTNYAASFVAVLDQSLQRLAPQPLFLLELASFLAPKGQFLRIYETIAAHSSPGHVQKHGIHCSLAQPETHVLELSRWSLVRCRGEEFDVHPLVQAVVRDRLSSADKKHRLMVLLRLFFMPFGRIAGPNDSSCWDVWYVVFPHMEAFARHVRKGGDPRALGYLLNHMGLFLESQGLHAKAVAMLREAVDAAEATVGPENPDTAAALSNLGELLTSIGRPAEAKPFLLKAAEIIERTKPIVPHGDSSCWNNLGLCHKALGEREAAETAFRKAVALDKARGGSDDDSGLMHQANLANLLCDTGRKDEAEQIYRNVAAKMKDGVRKAFALTNLGALLHRTGRAAEAVGVLERAIGLLSRFFRPSHPRIKKATLHLAVARKKSTG